MQAFAWNYVAFMAAVLALVLVGLGFLNNGARLNRESFARSVPAVARVLKMGRSTSSRSYRAVIVDLLIQVHRPGVEPYELSRIVADEQPPRVYLPAYPCIPASL